MGTFAKQFPTDIIPHITDGKEINDRIHNYRRPKPSQALPAKGKAVANEGGLDLEDKKQNIGLEQARPTLSAEDLRNARKMLKQPDISKLIGLVAHLAYWNVFGHFNKMPLDLYHRKQLFISITQIKMNLELKYGPSRFYSVFMAPLLILAIRIEVELIFKNQYPEFFSVELHEKIAMKLINDLITQLIDPNLYYSRFSFFESSREAINIKTEKAKVQGTTSSKEKFYRRSALIE